MVTKIKMKELELLSCYGTGYGLDGQGTVVQFLAVARDTSLLHNIQNSSEACQDVMGIMGSLGGGAPTPRAEVKNGQ
jgi:hypothetical protein